MFVLAYFVRFLFSSDASQFCHETCIKRYLMEIKMGGETWLTSVGGWRESWLHWRGRGAALHGSSSDRTDSSFVPMVEKVDHECWFCIMIAKYVPWVASDTFDIASLVAHLKLCCKGRHMNCCLLISFLSTWLLHLDFELRLRQVHSDLRDRILLRCTTLKRLSFARPKDFNFHLVSAILTQVRNTVTSFRTSKGRLSFSF